MRKFRTIIQPINFAAVLWIEKLRVSGTDVILNSDL